MNQVPASYLAISRRSSWRSIPRVALLLVKVEPLRRRQLRPLAHAIGREHGSPHLRDSLALLYIEPLKDPWLRCNGTVNNCGESKHVRDPRRWDRVLEIEVSGKAVADYFDRLADEDRGFALGQVVEVGVFCLERASGVRDLDFVRSQIDGLLTAVEQMVRGIPKTVGEDLLQQLGTKMDGRWHLFGSSSTVRRSHTNERVNGVRDLLTTKMDPDSRASTLGNALGSLKDLLDPRRSDSSKAR